MYLRIARKLNDDGMKVELEPLFKRFLKLFQKEEPLIHLLHEEMEELIKSIIRRFWKQIMQQFWKTWRLKIGKSATWNENRTGRKYKNNLIHKLDKQKLPVLAMKKFYQTVVEYFQRKLPINSELLQDMKCLHPLLQKDKKKKAA